MNVSWSLPQGVLADVVDEVTIKLSPAELLAVATALRVADNDLLRSEGIVEGVIMHVDEAFEIIDGVTSVLFGEDWSDRVETPVTVTVVPFHIDDDLIQF